MTPLRVRNGQSFLLRDIPFCGTDAWRQSAADAMTEGCRLVGLYPLDKNNPRRLVSVFADSASSIIRIYGAESDSDAMNLPSLASEFPQTQYFESALAEEYGYRISDNASLRPVRKLSPPGSPARAHLLAQSGIEMHEVAVGPIHAGIIEPGHFAFQCHGETVYNLEVELGYQHRGIEKLILEAHDHQRIPLSESIAGDTVIGHAGAHCMAMESLANAQLSLHAQVLRCVCEELERIAMHLAGLSGIANDVGFALVSSSYGRLRTLAINSLADLTGSRFGRGLHVYGGVRFALTDEIHGNIRHNLMNIRDDVQIIDAHMFSSAGILTRFNEVGIVSGEEAVLLGITGPAARASGRELDTRLHFPYGAYRYYPVSLFTLNTGDVAARIRLRTLELEDSIRAILDMFDTLPGGPIRGEMDKPAPDSGVVVLVEGWRGEIVHAAFTTGERELRQYRIHDPSCINWTALPLALRGTAISDFPLCNKSFDLSYAGHDL